MTIDVEAHDAAGHRWLFDVAGPFASHRGGLLRTEAVWRALGRASAIRGRLGPDVPIVLLASHLPRRPSESDTILRAAGPDAFFDAIDLLSTDARARLARYATGGHSGEPQPGFWTAEDWPAADVDAGTRQRLSAGQAGVFEGVMSSLGGLATA